jgi:copper chaperone CopZ
VRDALLSVPGVRNVEVSFHDQEATLEYDPGQASLKDLVAVVESLGFQAWDTATERRGAPP